MTTFVLLEDKMGAEFWINPAHVALVRHVAQDRCRIIVAGVGASDTAIEVLMPTADVIHAIDAVEEAVASIEFEQKQRRGQVTV